MRSLLIYYYLFEPANVLAQLYDYTATPRTADIMQAPGRLLVHS